MAKYKVGDVLKPKLSVGSKLQVVEIQENTCYMGTQAFYHCRIYLNESSAWSGSKRQKWNPSNAKLVAFNEIEVEPFVEEVEEKKEEEGKEE